MGRDYLVVAKDLSPRPYDGFFAFALLSSYVLSELKNLLLVAIELRDIPYANMVPLLINLVTALIFVTVFVKTAPTSSLPLFQTLCLSLIVISFSWLMFPQNQEYLLSVGRRSILFTLPIFTFAYLTIDVARIRKITRSASYITFVIALLRTATMFFSPTYDGSYSMSLSYALLLPALVSLDDLFDRVTLKSLFIFIGSLGAMLLFGSRGALLCIFVFYFSYTILHAIYERQNRLWYALFSTAPFLLYGFRKSLVQWLIALLPTGGHLSRTLTLFLRDDVYLSGREEIYARLLTEIKRHPLVGIGIAGDRYLFQDPGLYSHNIVLEIISSFGIIIGSVLLFALLRLCLRVVFNRSSINERFYLMWFSLGVVYLFYSGSYITSFQFWIFMGFSLRKLTFDRQPVMKIPDISEKINNRSE